MKRIFILSVLALSCQEGLNETSPLPSLDRAYFDCRVQPVLTKNCGALACHGSAKRQFYLFSRNRLRLGGSEKDRGAFMKSEERRFNFDAARAFADEHEPLKSWLLLKPLQTELGGYYHVMPNDGPDVFGDSNNLEYQTLVSWVTGSQEDPACEEPGSKL